MSNLRKILAKTLLVTMFIFLIGFESNLSYAGVKLAAGQLNVIFKKGIAKRKAKEFVKNQGLEIEHTVTAGRWRKRPHVVVIVPKGEEKEWIEKLQKENMVKGVTYCHIYTHISPHLKEYCE